MNTGLAAPAGVYLTADQALYARQVRRAESVARVAMQHGASQDELELAAAIRLVMEAEPQVILEIGCDRGGTLYAWRQLCDEVYGITLEANADSGGARCADHGAAVFYGDSHDPEALGWVRDQLVGRQVDVLVIDGDHSFPGVVQDVVMYAPLVRAGGLILMHDILPEHFPAVKTWRLWPQLTALYQTSEIRMRFGWGIIHVAEGDHFAAVSFAQE